MYTIQQAFEYSYNSTFQSSDNKKLIKRFFKECTMGEVPTKRDENFKRLQPFVFSKYRTMKFTFC